MQMLCISISFIQKHMILTYCLVECNLNTSMDKYQKYPKCHDNFHIFDIFYIFENIAIFSNPDSTHPFDSVHLQFH